MSNTERRFLRQEVDYLGFLESKLRDLQGLPTLVYELVQNADDVKDENGQPAASRITFDIRDNALVVENDGVFLPKDFARMQRVASGGKREEEGTTGAFGVGFIAVYQITDQPELFSSGQHWTFLPAEQRIKVEAVETTETRFVLPWAFEPQSEVRRKLRIEAVRRDQIPQFEHEIAQALSLAAWFLKQLYALELKRSGVLIKCIQRIADEQDQLLIQDNDQPLIWRRLTGHFDDEALSLRRRFQQQIEAKRVSSVVVAIPDEPLPSGRLFAVLPTEQTTPLPLHINADFFTTSDRKQIILGDDYQSHWNRAAIRAAARILADHFDGLRELMGHRGHWQLLERLDQSKQQTQRGQLDKAFAAFWETLEPSLRTKPIVYTTTGDWIVPHLARQLESKAEQESSPILEQLGISIVHSDLRRHFSLMETLGVRRLSIMDVVEALSHNGLDKPVSLDQAPAGLQSVENWQILWRALEALLQQSPHRQPKQVQDREGDALQKCAIALDSTDTLRAPQHLFHGDPAARTLFPQVAWLSEKVAPEGVPGRLVPEFAVGEAVDLLAKISAERLEKDWKAGVVDIKGLYRWFEERRAAIASTPDLRSQLCALPIWPASSGHLHRLSELYLPGGFTDPLRLSELVDVKALGGRKEFLLDLEVRELTFETYLRERVPRALYEGCDLPLATRRELVRLLATRIGEIRGNDSVRSHLRSVPLVECIDGIFRPATKVYASHDVTAILGEHIHVAAPATEHIEAIQALYVWLGVAQKPRPEDVVRRVEEVTQGRADASARLAVKAVFQYLATQWSGWEHFERSQYQALRSRPWLPGTKDSKWYTPNELYATCFSHPTPGYHSPVGPQVAL